jgi:succinate dehydrogenase/fumarate reductase flavoprotein subunit
MIGLQAMCRSPMSCLASRRIRLASSTRAVFRNQEARVSRGAISRHGGDTTRSEVILAMAKEIHAGRAGSTGGIFMDATKVPMEVIKKQIPHVYKTCLHRHIDISKTPLEVAPGSHTWLGGLEIDIDGKTPVDGLFAAGETAGGIHGGNRIGGSALSASLVYGRRAGKRAAALVRTGRVDLPSSDEDAIPEAERAWLAGLLNRDSGPSQSDVRMACRTLAHEVGLI